MNGLFEICGTTPNTILVKIGSATKTLPLLRGTNQLVWVVSPPARLMADLVFNLRPTDIRMIGCSMWLLNSMAVTSSKATPMICGATSTGNLVPLL